MDPARLPPGQKKTEQWPVVHAGGLPKIDPAAWRLRLFGLVQEERELDLQAFRSLPRVETLADLHCVEGWSRLDNRWDGVSASALLAMAKPRPEARFVIIHAENGWTTDLPLSDFAQPDVLFALSHDGKPLTPDHGGPVRLVVPRLYFWKSAKWVNGVELAAEDRPGYWELKGYHIHGDPWKEERYSS
ncbi:MAG: sulfite oxidase-like oxidoreductase [Elusimicrobiota bacterium]